MKLITLQDLEPGQLLARSLFDGRGELLLSVGYTLDNEMISLVQEHGFEQIYVMNEFSSEIKLDTVISDVVRAKGNKVVAGFMSEVREAALDLAGKRMDAKTVRESGAFRGTVNIAAMRGVVTDILDDIMNNETVMFASHQLRSSRSKDYDHALDVTLLCLILGKQLNYSTPELRQLGVAAMAHDIGKLALGDLADKRYDQLNADEVIAVKEHPVLSKVIVEQNGSNTFKEQITVLQHHEQADGSGYPQGLKSGVFALDPEAAQRGEGLHGSSTGKVDPWAGNIHPFAQILGLANQYDNLLTGTYDVISYSPAEALQQLIHGHAGAWNPLILAKLFDTIQIYPAGSTVRILDNSNKRFLNCQGVIAESNDANPACPKIVITHDQNGRPRAPVMVDFTREAEMELELVA